PQDQDVDEGDGEREERRPVAEQLAPELPAAGHLLDGGDAQGEDEDRRRDREDAVAERLDTPRLAQQAAVGGAGAAVALGEAAGGGRRVHAASLPERPPPRPSSGGGRGATARRVVGCGRWTRPRDSRPSWPSSPPRRAPAPARGWRGT